MNVADFDYALPPERIAQHPVSPRDASRLLVLPRDAGPAEHRRFAELDELLEAGDLLVLNDTRVVPARLVGRKPSGGRVELLLLEAEEGAPRRLRCWLRSARPPAAGGRIELPGDLVATVLGRAGGCFTLDWPLGPEETARYLERFGKLPLPPYVRREDDAPTSAEDAERYQTIYAQRAGAVAAPTAGLHFTAGLLERLERRGVARATLTLHVGIGTFEPVRVASVEAHRMHEERFELPAATAAALRRTREAGGRVVAVGTTVVRVLEHCADGAGGVRAGRGRSDLFIYPGFRFRVVDALITNFHLPRSTLLMLVAAFTGRERLLATYGEAVARGYRFFSYGDAMLVR